MSQQHLPGGARCEVKLRTSGAICITLGGELDLAVSSIVKPALARAQSEASVVVVDLARVEFMDSTGVHMLLDADARARRDGGQLIVARPAHAVRRLLSLTETLDLLTIQDEPAGSIR